MRIARLALPVAIAWTVILIPVVGHGRGDLWRGLAWTMALSLAVLVVSLLLRRLAVRMEHPITAMGAFASERELAALAVELGSPLDQLLDRGGPFLHQNAHCRAVAQAVAGK
jgi:hypothetical protein